MFRMALGCLFDPTCFLLLCRISLDLYNCIGVLLTRPRCIMDEHRVSNCVSMEPPRHVSKFDRLSVVLSPIFLTQLMVILCNTYAAWNWGLFQMRQCFSKPQP